MPSTFYNTLSSHAVSLSKGLEWADEQADLGLTYPHMPVGTFSPGMYQMIYSLDTVVEPTGEEPDHTAAQGHLWLRV